MNKILNLFSKKLTMNYCAFKYQMDYGYIPIFGEFIRFGIDVFQLHVNQCHNGFGALWHIRVDIADDEILNLFAKCWIFRHLNKNQHFIL